MTYNTLNETLPNQAIAKENQLLKIAIVVATLSTIIINALANIVPFNNQQTGEISDRYQILFVPAGYVFSIWGIIYVGMLAYSTYQARTKENNSFFWSKIGFWYLLSCLANSAWIFLWHWNLLGWSVVVISVLLVSLLAIYLQMMARDWETGKRTTAELWTVYIPLSVYLAWASVATVANVSTWLWDLGWSGWGISETGWALLMLVVGAGLGVFFGYWRRNLAYAAVIVWAFVGIAIKQAALPTVANASYLLAAVVLIAALLGLRRSLHRQ